MMRESKPLTQLLLMLALLVFGAHGIPRYCSQTIRAIDSARSVFEETKITAIAPNCPINSLIWKKPRFDHIIVFHKLELSFRLCLTMDTAGVCVYRMKGASRQLVARAGASGDLGCFESQCKHLTFMVRPDEDMDMQRIRFTYTYNEITKNPKCTETCQKSCLCNSKYVFIGTLKDIVQDPHTLLYRLYFKIDRFMKYNGAYTGRLHTYQNHICSNHSSSGPATPISYKWPNLVPMQGIVKVYSESPLAAREKHLVAGSLYRLGGKRRMVLCCVDEDERYTLSVLKNLIFHQFCECY